MRRCVASSKRLRYSAAYDIVVHSSELSDPRLLFQLHIRPSVGLLLVWLLASLSARLTVVGMQWGSDAAFFDNTIAARAQFTFMSTEE